MASLWHVSRAEEGPNHEQAGKLGAGLAGRGGEPAIAALGGSEALWPVRGLAAYGIAAGLLGARSGRPGWTASAHGSHWGQFAALKSAQADRRAHETHGRRG